MNTVNRQLKRHLGDFVLGAVDGTITTFAIVSGIVGAKLPEATTVALILGFANVAADGFSMGASNYLKARSDQDTHALMSAAVTFAAFILIGTFPLLPFAYKVIFNSPLSLDAVFLLSLCSTAICFIGTGALRASLSQSSYLRCIFETLAIGSVAATLAYYVGEWISTLV